MTMTEAYQPEEKAGAAMLQYPIQIEGDTSVSLPDTDFHNFSLEAWH